MTGKTCVSIATQDPVEMVRKTLRSFAIGADLIEPRFDHCADRIPDMLKVLRPHAEKSVFTLRSEDQGGRFTGSTDEYFAIIKRLAEQNPHLLDIQLSMARQRPEIVSALKANGAHLLISDHNLNNTPEVIELLSTFTEMRVIRADAYKIITTALDAKDYGRTRALYKLAKANMLIAYPMGEQPEIMEERIRIIRDLDAPLSFAALDEESKTAAGQWTILEMIKKLKKVA